MDSNTKSGEPNIQQSQDNISQLCKGQCGFFGNADNQGFCSVCFKQELLKQEKKADEKKEVDSKSRLSVPESSSGSVTDAMADLMKPTASTPTSPTSSLKSTEPRIEADCEQAEEQPPAKKQKKKCGICKKKLGLTGFECRCGHFYCGIHRYSDQHRCSFDYKSDGRKLIAAQNPAVRGDKITKL